MNIVLYRILAYCKTHLNLCLLSILIGIVIFHLLLPDFVQFSKNLIWDGEYYIYYAQHFPDVAFGHKINAYRFQRLFPSGVVYYGALLLKVPLTKQSVIQAFLALNVLLIFISLGIWLKICRQLGLSNKGKLLGFTGLFVNFAILKMPFYYPALTDVMAFTLGLGLLYCYLRRSTAGTLAIALLGAFSFPTVFYSALLLFIFPAEEPNLVYSDKSKNWNTWLALLTTGGFLLLVIAFCFYRKVPLINPNAAPVLLLSIVLTLAYLFFAARAFYKIDLYVQIIKNFNAWGRSMVAILILAGVYIVVLKAASSQPSHINYKGILANIVVSSIANPLTFLVSHAVYVGPVVLVLIYYVKPFVQQINKHGLGLHLVILGYVLLSVTSETRLFINAWPFFVAFLCKAMEEIKLPQSFYICLFLFALALSKFWYRIDVTHFSENYLQFPEQRYFMSQGPWMSDAMYLLQGAVVLLVFFWLYWFYFRKQKLPAVP